MNTVSYRWRPAVLVGLVCPILVGLFATTVLCAAEGPPTVEITSPATPPEWALWERRVLDRLYPAAMEFVRKYTREDGTLIWRDEWPGMDGSDDGYESFYNFALY